MQVNNDARLETPAEQIVYANILTVGVWGSLVLMLIFYFLYVFGVIQPHVSFELLTANWGEGVQTYLQNTDTPSGWGWLVLLGKGDFLNYLGFCILALITNVCFLALLIGFIKRKDWIFAAISFTEIVVLTLAASGIFGTGGH